MLALWRMGTSAQRMSWVGKRTKRHSQCTNGKKGRGTKEKAMDTKVEKVNDSKVVIDLQEKRLVSA